MLVFLALSCSRSALTAPADSSEPPPLPYEVQLTGGAAVDDPLPLVVTLHGRASDPVRFQKFFDLDRPARVVHLEAPIREHDGRAWFSFRGKTREMLQTEIDELADRAVRTTLAVIEDRPSLGKPVLAGFSQGSMVVYTMVMRHPEVFRKAVPVAGALFGTELALRDDSEMPTVIAMHGLKDPVMNPGSSARAVDVLQSLGFSAELRLFPDAIHWIQGDLKQALHEEVLDGVSPGGPATDG